MSSAVAHVPAPPPKRVTGRRVGGVADGPIGQLNERKGNDKAWEAEVTRDSQMTKALLADAASMRARNQQSQTTSRRQVQEQNKIVFDNLTKKVKLLKGIRHKLQTAETKLTRANDSLAAAHQQADELTARLERPLQKCTARSQLRLKRPGAEKIADDVAHAVQIQAEGIADFQQRLKTFTIGAAQLEDENLRHIQALRADIVLKNSAIKVEEECLVLNGKLDASAVATPSGGESPAAQLGGTRDSALSGTRGSGFGEADVLHHAGRNAPADATAWQQRTAVNLERAQQLLDQTIEHTSKMVAYMAKVRKHHSSLNATTKHAFESKTKATVRQEQQLEENLNRLEDEIQSLLEQRDAIGQDMQERQKPLMIAKQRLDARRNRPNAENVRDAVEQELEKEFLLLATSIQQLEERQRRVDAEVARIQATHARLRQQLMHKQSALALDRECLDLEDMSTYNLSSRGGSSVASSRGSSRQSGRRQLDGTSGSARASSGVRSTSSSRPGSRQGAGVTTASSGSFLPPVTGATVSSMNSSSPRSGRRYL